MSGFGHATSIDAGDQGEGHHLAWGVEALGVRVSGSGFEDQIRVLELWGKFGAA